MRDEPDSCVRVCPLGAWRVLESRPCRPPRVARCAACRCSQLLSYEGHDSWRALNAMASELISVGEDPSSKQVMGNKQLELTLNCLHKALDLSPDKAFADWLTLSDGSILRSWVLHAINEPEKLEWSELMQSQMQQFRRHVRPLMRTLIRISGAQLAVRILNHESNKQQEGAAFNICKMIRVAIDRAMERSDRLLVEAVRDGGPRTPLDGKLFEVFNEWDFHLPVAQGQASDAATACAKLALESISWRLDALGDMEQCNTCRRLYFVGGRCGCTGRLPDLFLNEPKDKSLRVCKSLQDLCKQLFCAKFEKHDTFLEVAMDLRLCASVVRDDSRLHVCVPTRTRPYALLRAQR